MTTTSALRASLPSASSLIVVDARPAADYAVGHVPGAISLEWEEWCGAPPGEAAPVLFEPGYWGALREAPASWWAESLSAKGLASHKPIVVYADSVVSKGREGRIAWMLLYLGADDVALLDGGWQAWLEEGGAVEEGVGHMPTPAAFVVSFAMERRWTQGRTMEAYHQGRLPLLVDTRTLPEFEGDCYDYLPRKGRLPDSILFPFAALFDGERFFVGRDLYLSRLPEPMAAPTPYGKLTYCEVGVRASLAALLHELYTGEGVGVFDGSLIEWALAADLPVVGPSYV